MFTTCIKFFDRLDEAGISYCHWKSNEHLEAALSGQTDLDILVATESRETFAEVARSLGFVRFIPVPYLRYRSIEDYIGIDELDACLIHAHVHFALEIGRKFVKNFHLPWEAGMFRDSVLFDATRVRIASPEWELVVLIIRRAAKGMGSLPFSLSIETFSADEQREFEWLKARIDTDAFSALTLELFPANIAYKLFEAVKSDEKRALSKVFTSIRNRILPGFAATASPSDREPFVTLRYAARKLRAAMTLTAYKKFGAAMPYRRYLPGRGVLIAFLGADGSGKSTVLSGLRSWLSWKIDFRQVYFGSGDGKASLLRAPLRMVARLRTHRRGDVSNLTKAEKDRDASRPSLRAAKIVWAFLLAKEKLRKARFIARARERGLIVLTDRYPQARFEGLNDGPLLGDLKDHRNPVLRSLGRWERNVYEHLQTMSPDLVIKLSVPLEIALERKKDTPAYVIREKARIVEALSYAGSPSVSIRTDVDLEVTMREARRAVWQAIRTCHGN